MKRINFQLALLVVAVIIASCSNSASSAQDDPLEQEIVEVSKLVNALEERKNANNYYDDKNAKIAVSGRIKSVIINVSYSSG
jgi:hypothetical protein